MTGQGRPPVIVTRAEPGASETFATLQALGLEVIKSPVLVLEHEAFETPQDLAGVAGLIFTSANGVRAFADRFTSRSAKAFCVGPRTLQEARQVGFNQAVSADGDAGDLLRLIQSQWTRGAGHLVHIANIHAAGELVERLRDQGFDVAFWPLYKTVPAAYFAAEVQAWLECGPERAYVLVHSAKAADAFCDLARPKATRWRNSIAVAISPKAGRALSSLPFREICFADAPNEAALSNALRAAMKTHADL